MKELTKAYRLIFSIISVVSCTLITFPIQAQDEYTYSENVLSEDKIQDLKDLAQYDKRENQLVVKERELKVTDQPKYEMNPGIAILIKVFTYTLIGALVFFILYLIFSSIKIDPKVNTEIAPEIEEIEDIDEIDAESGLEKALKVENYRDAVRMLFIKVLQVLVAEKSIEWKPEKTNRDYLKEMNKHSKIEHFTNLVIAYERIWYGSEPIDRLFFDFLKADFDKFYSTGNVEIDVKD